MPDPTPEATLFSELLVEVFRVNGALLEAGDALTRPVGLSSARWQVLGIVEHGPAPVAHIARSMGLSRQAVQQTADALEREGFVTYLDNPHHKRAKRVALTPKGEEALVYVRGQQALWANRIAQGQTQGGLRAALETLQGLREALERDVPGREETP